MSLVTGEQIELYLVEVKTKAYFATLAERKTRYYIASFIAPLGNFDNAEIGLMREFYPNVRNLSRVSETTIKRIWH